MKTLFLAAGVGLMLTACSRQDNTGYSSSADKPGPATARISTNNEGARSTTELAGPETAVGAAVTASSGTGTATAQGSTANESAANEGKNTGENQNLNGQPATPPAGTGVPNSAINTNETDRAKSGTTTPLPR